MPTVFFVGDNADWACKWHIHYITQALQPLGVQTHVTRNPWQLTNSTIHFVNRYAYLQGPFRHLHPSNTVYMNWFHGRPDDPTMRPICECVTRAARHLHRIVVSCRSGARILESLGVERTKIMLLPLGVDLERFVPKTELTRTRIRDSLGIPRDATCIGSFQKDGNGWGTGDDPKLIKGPDVFLDVVDLLRRRHANLCVLLTGPARGYVKRGLDRIGVPYVHAFLRQYHDIIEYYHALDAYLVASRDEGGPLALLESWATGVPIVSTKVGMCADLIVHGQNGMLSNVESVADLAGNISAVIEDKELRQRLIANALKAVQTYSWDEIGNLHYTRLYDF